MSAIDVTDHAAQRYMSKTGCSTIERAREQLLRLAGHASRADGDRRFARGFVLVFEGDTIVTVYRATELGLRREAEARTKRVWRDRLPRIPREERDEVDAAPRGKWRARSAPRCRRWQLDEEAAP